MAIMQDVKTQNNLRRLRRARYLTQEELAEAAGLALSTVQRIESGEVEPRLKTIRHLAGVLKVEPQEIKEA